MAALATLKDDFSGSLATLWTTVGGSPTTTNSKLNLPATVGYTYIQSTSTYDATGSSVIFEICQAGNGASVETGAGPILNASNTAQMFVTGSNITFRRVLATVANDTTIAYNSQTMRWGRIRESGGNMLWDTAPSPVDVWTNRKSLAPGFAITALKMELYCGGATTGTDGIFDNVNVVARRPFVRRSINRRPARTGAGRFV